MEIPVRAEKKRNALLREIEEMMERQPRTMFLALLSSTVSLLVTIQNHL